MIAVLSWCDGFGNDTFIRGIYPSLQEAKHEEEDRWVEFQYGEVEFDWYEANKFKESKKKKRKRD